MQSEIVRIAHLSDPHFGAGGNTAVWDTLVDFLCKKVCPELVLITGDLVNTPTKKHFARVQAALEELNTGLGGSPGQNKKYIVCAGNHDRHIFGNAIPGKKASKKFDGANFGCPPLSNPHVRWLGSSPHRWKVRVASVDSSVRARYSAQAFLDSTELAHLRALKDWRDPDGPPYLVLLLMHHHLLPLPAVEATSQSASDVFRLTSAVNPGTILENLAASLVDIVLHGHEHKRHLARYASYQPNSGQVAIVAAASATGMETKKGWTAANASFNLLELRPDRSVWISEGKYASADGWKIAADSAVELLDSTALRHNRFTRALHLSRKEMQHQQNQDLFQSNDKKQQSEWQKHIILTERRDAIVTEKRTEWPIRGGAFSFQISKQYRHSARSKSDDRACSFSN